MAVLKKFRPRWWLSNRQTPTHTIQPNIALVPPVNARYDLRPLTVAQLDECWHLDQRCFVSQNSAMAGFVIGLLEPDHTGHITTVGIAPEHRRRRLASCLIERVEDAFRRRDVRLARLEVRSTNLSAQKLYQSLGYSVTQRLPKYYSNGGDGLLMVKAI